MGKQTEAKQEEKQLTKSEMMKLIEESNPYADYESTTTTKAIKSPSTNQQKYIAHVHKAMEEGERLFGVKVENQQIIKTERKHKRLLCLVVIVLLMKAHTKNEAKSLIFVFLNYIYVVVVTML